MRVYIKTFGCSLNHADSETISGGLLQNGHEIVDSEEQADIILYNTCTVKNPTQDSFLANLKKQKKPVVIAGCMPQADKKGMFSTYAVLGTEQLARASEVVESAASGMKLRLLEKNKNEIRLNQPKKRTNPLVEIVPICAGCLSNCTYCKTKQARGNLRSYRPMDIEEQCKTAIEEGVKEIWLTSQDNGAYGMDIGTNAGELLTRIAQLEGDFMIRFGMTNPDWTKKWLKELVAAYKEPKVYKFLHLPIQAGSDRILKEMKRRCTADDIRMIVKTFREAIPDITIATDVICGYPTETEEEFKETVALCKELQFPVINISKFYARPDTPAATQPQVPNNIIKERSGEMTRVFEEEILPQTKKELVGKTVRALFVQRVDGTNIGKTENYTQVIVKSVVDLRGTWQNVLIEDAGLYDIRGRII